MRIHHLGKPQKTSLNGEVSIAISFHTYLLIENIYKKTGDILFLLRENISVFLKLARI